MRISHTKSRYTSYKKTKKNYLQWYVVPPEPRKLGIAVLFAAILSIAMSMNVSANEEVLAKEAQASWLQVSARKARPGSGAYSRSDKAEPSQAINDNKPKKETSAKKRVAKARPGSGARSRKASTESNQNISNKQVPKTNVVSNKRKARPGRNRSSAKSSEEKIVQN